jgi:hypothetical protein
LAIGSSASINDYSTTVVVNGNSFSLAGSVSNSTTTAVGGASFNVINTPPGSTTLTYQFSITNNGPLTHDDVLIIDTLAAYSSAGGTLPFAHLTDHNLSLNPGIAGVSGLVTPFFDGIGGPTGGFGPTPNNSAGGGGGSRGGLIRTVGPDFLIDERWTFSFPANYSGTLSETITGTIATYAVPGPAVGTGLPGLLMAIAGLSVGAAVASR